MWWSCVFVPPFSTYSVHSYQEIKNDKCQVFRRITWWYSKQKVDIMYMLKQTDVIILIIIPFQKHHRNSRHSYIQFWLSNYLCTRADEIKQIARQKYNNIFYCDAMNGRAAERSMYKIRLHIYGNVKNLTSL